MTTMWFKRGPGERAAVSVDEPAVLFDDGPPDWVRVPPEMEAQVPGMAGRRLRVLDAVGERCPMCGTEGRWLLLEERMIVAECLEHGFVWMRRPA